MNIETTIPQETPLKEKRPLHPQVTLVIPFDPKMTPKATLERQLADWQARVEKDLLIGYTSGEALPVIRKLQQICKNLNFSTHKRSLALFVSPEVATVLYMDMPVKERLVIDSPFSMKELLACRQQDEGFLVLLLSAHQSKMYVGNSSGLRIIKSNTPQNVYAWLHESPERTANSFDPAGRREVVLDKFLHHMDEGLAAVLKAYPLPVFVIGDPRVIGHFRKISRHSKNIAASIARNCLEATGKEIPAILAPYLAQWELIRQLDLLRQVEKATGLEKEIHGFNAVYHATRYGTGRQLIIEKDFTANDRSADDRLANVLPTNARSTNDHAAHAHAAPSPDPSRPYYLEDAVDDIIQKVLAKGGSVEWVDRGFLEEYGHIVLIK